MNQLTLHGLVVIEGQATYERIITAVRDMEPDEALRHVQNFLKIYPEFPQAHNDLAVLYYQAGNCLKALAHYEKAHKLEPANIIFRKNLADFYFVELEWADDAIQAYLDILKDNPFDIETLNALGTISIQLGRREQARKYFNRTLQLDAVNNHARQALHQLGDGTAEPPQQAPLASSPLLNHSAPAEPRQSPSPVQPFVKSPEVPKSAEQLYREAFELVNSGNSMDILRALEDLVLCYPAYALAHNDLGVLRFRLGDIEGAQRAYERAVELEPINSRFRKNLADLYFMELERPDDAIRIYLDLHRLDPRDLETLAGLGRICIAINLPDEATSFYRRALEVDPCNVEIKAALQELM